MKMKRIALLIFLCSSLLANQDDADKKFNIVNKMNSSIDPKIILQNTTEQSSKNVLENSNTLENMSIVKNKPILENKSDITTCAITSDGNSQGYLNKTKGFWKKYKYHIILSSVAGSYGAILFLLSKGHLYLSKENKWSSWPKNKAFQEVLELPQQELAELLLQNIQTKYKNEKNKIDFISPMATFINEVEKEKRTIIFYTRLYTFLKKMHLINLFPVSNRYFENTNEKLQRLSYIKNVFLSWATNIPPSRFSNKKSRSFVEKKDSKLANISVQVTNSFSPTLTSYLSNPGSGLKTAAFHGIHAANQLVNEMINTTRTICKKTKQFTQKHKYYLIPSAILTSYITALFCVSRGNSYLDKKELWSAWKKEIATQDLILDNNNSELVKNLLLEIQTRHMDKNNPIDFITPLANFIKNMEQEKRSLTFYANIYNMLKSSHLLKLFPVDKTCFHKVEDQIQRLHFIRSIFLTWAARYKIEQNKALPIN